MPFASSSFLLLLIGNIFMPFTFNECYSEVKKKSFNEG